MQKKDIFRNESYILNREDYISDDPAPRRRVVFQLGFGVDIGLTLQWSKQKGRRVD